jgi:hypothetical protein
MRALWLFDVLALAGLGLIAWGLGWLLHPAWAPVTIGAALVTVAVLSASKSGGTPPRRTREE